MTGQHGRGEESDSKADYTSIRHPYVAIRQTIGQSSLIIQHFGIVLIPVNVYGGGKRTSIYYTHAKRIQSTLSRARVREQSTVAMHIAIYTCIAMHSDCV